MRHPLALGAVAATVALLAAGCGGSTKSTTSAASSSPYSETQSTSAAASTTSSTSAPASSTGAGVLLSTKHSKLGTILAAGPKQLTVYLFAADAGPASSCSGTCAQVWPPVTTTGAPRVGGAALAADLGTITRSDGAKQVTYKGHPLYYYLKDKDDGDTYGQGVNGFGASWYAMKPSGVKLDNS